jgi:hypothetical protein
VMRIGLRGWSFEALGDPVASFAGGDVHELGADGRAVETARVGGEVIVEVELGDRERLEILAEGIEVRLEIAPAAEGVESLVFDLRRGGRGRVFEGSRSHGASSPHFTRVLRKPVAHGL